MSQQIPSPNSNDTIQIKLLVGSAAEAVKTIQQKFGDQAKVISVKQVEADGLRRLIQKPRLEVIVQVSRDSIQSAGTLNNIEPSAAELAKPEPKSTTTHSPDVDALVEKPKSVEQPAAQPSRPPITEMYSKSESASSGYFDGIEEENTSNETEDSSGRLGSAANPVKRGTLEAVKRAISMLKALGLDDSLIERIRYELDFQNLGKMPAVDLYTRICDWLHGQVSDATDETLGKRRAFIGSCGAGKTAALCKALSAEVFVNKHLPSVLKIDSSLPNPSDGLEAFCEIVGSPMSRSIDEVSQISEDRPLFIDTPGLDFASEASVDLLKAQLDALETTERVLVINAAYDSESILESMTAGERIGVTHIVFSHLDETRRVGKLWKYVLSERVKPWFFSHGPNPAGDYTLDCFSYLLQRTFPHGSLLSEASVKREISVASAANKEEVVAL